MARQLGGFTKSHAARQALFSVLRVSRSVTPSATLRTQYVEKASLNNPDFNFIVYHSGSSTGRNDELE